MTLYEYECDRLHDRTNEWYKRREAISESSLPEQAKDMLLDASRVEHKQVMKTAHRLMGE
jgi:hypothetical protein